MNISVLEPRGFVTAPDPAPRTVPKRLGRPPQIFLAEPGERSYPSAVPSSPTPEQAP